MGFGRRVARGMLRRAGTSMLDKVGRRLVRTLGDTSSDAPDAAFAPKRNLYEQMRSGEVDEVGKAVDASGEDHDHDHDHGHDHGHKH